jgi:hypothetical protein
LDKREGCHLDDQDDDAYGAGLVIRWLLFLVVFLESDGIGELGCGDEGVAWTHVL